MNARTETLMRRSSASGGTTSALCAETALIGTLMQHPPHAAARVLRRITEDDLTDPHAATTARVIRDLAAAGAVSADPVTVLSHARATGVVTRDHQTSRFARWLLDAWATPAPAAAAHHLADLVADAAYRRHITTWATRAAHAADCADLDAVHRLLATAARDLATTRRRLLPQPAPRLVARPIRQEFAA